MSRRSRLIHRATRVEPRPRSLAPLVLVLSLSGLAACDTSPTQVAAGPEQLPQGAYGSLRVPLSTELDGVVYRLSATFTLTGTAELTFATDDLSSDDQVLEQVLSAGSYQLRLDGFELYADTPDGAVPQQAELLSPVELSIEIFPDETTRVAFRFGIDGGEVAFGDGALAIGFSVERTGCQTAPLPLSVRDADYSGSLDAVVLLGDSPSVVSIVDPRTLERTEVALPLPGSDISVGPDGLTAAVAHDGFLSVVDLASALLLDTIPTSSPSGDVVLAGNGFAYILPIYDQWVSVHSIDLAARQDINEGSFGSSYAGTRLMLHPGGTSLYAITVGLSPTDLSRYDISAGPASYPADSPYHGDYTMCADIWPSRDGLRLFTACGTVFRTLPGSPDDMTYNGTLQGGARRFSSIAHDPGAGLVYALSSTPTSVFDPLPAESRLEVYSYDYLNLVDTREIPCFRVPQGEPRALGEFVFASSAGDAIFVVSRADPEAGLLRDWGIAVLAP